MRLTKENRYLCYSSRHFTYSVPHCLSVSGERTILRCGPEPTTSWTTSLFLMHCCRKSSDWNIHVTGNYYCCSLLLHHLYVKYQTGEVVFDHISKHLKKKLRITNWCRDYFCWTSNLHVYETNVEWAIVKPKKKYNNNIQVFTSHNHYPFCCTQTCVVWFRHKL